MTNKLFLVNWTSKLSRKDPQTQQRDQLLYPWPRLTLNLVVTAMVVTTIFLWGMAGTDVNVYEFFRGTPDMANSIYNMFPPEFKITLHYPQIPSITLLGFTTPSILFRDWQYPYLEALSPILETVQMAIVGTVLGVLLSLPFGFLAARNASPHPSIYHGTRILLNANRAIPDIILGILFVVAVGLGPFAGVLALAVGSIGTVGKLFAESVESIDPQQVLAVRATGAGGVITFLYAVLPQALPVMASYSLLLFEHNVRSATILGMVGAGGVGQILLELIGMMKYKELMGYVIILVITVTLIDRMSDFLRKKII